MNREGLSFPEAVRKLADRVGVVIPESNVKHLMLRRDVVEAVEQGKFRVFAVASVDQALELLTGQSAGERGKDGQFPPDTINGKVEARLLELFELRQSFAEAAKKAQESIEDIDKRLAELDAGASLGEAVAGLGKEGIKRS